MAAPGSVVLKAKGRMSERAKRRRVSWMVIS